MSDWTPAELIATVLSRRLEDGEVVITGTNAAIPSAAYRMAQLLDSRRLHAISGGLGTVDPVAQVIPPSSGDEDFLAGTATIPLPEIVRLEVRGLIDAIFLGAIQVDRRCRCNLAVVGDYERPRLRGPGTLGLSLVAAIPKTLIYLTRHDTDTFVENVDFVSADGLRGGVQTVVTPLAVFEPDPARTELRLASVHPGVEPEEVAARTGFAVDPAAATVTEPPSEAELAALRSVDRAGQLREPGVTRA
jgi:glutaconate CoA-transferase subunit B